jgi:hypothetical protein
VKALNGVPTDQQLQAQGNGPLREPAALLFLALSPQARRGQAAPVEESIGTASVQNIFGISAIVDAWGTPLQFTGVPAQFSVNGTFTPAVISAGRDKQFNTNDDINSSDLRKTSAGPQ